MVNDSKSDSSAAGADGRIVQKELLETPDHLVTAYMVTYVSEGLLVKGYLVLPEQSCPLPGLLYCRGGMGRIGMVQLSRLTALARLGYVVFAPFYRGNENGEGRDEFGGADRHDVFSALALLRSLGETTDSPIPVIGFSRGAFMALLAARECAGVGPVIAWSGVSDLRLTYEERVDLRRMLKRVVGHPRKEPEQYTDRSPVEWADRIHSPVLIIHGTEDSNVSIEHSYRLAAALETAGREYSLHVREGMEHLLSPAEEEQIMMTIHLWLQDQG